MSRSYDYRDAQEKHWRDGTPELAKYYRGRRASDLAGCGCWLCHLGLRNGAHGDMIRGIRSSARVRVRTLLRHGRHEEICPKIPIPYTD
jgi:hypothetical protein